VGARLGTEVRLPTDFEWQLAATGGDPANTYPWGAHWDPEREPWRANTTESELLRSIAVGMYPAGKSRGGVLDLAGNLWEWCASDFDHRDDIRFPRDSLDFRVLRGGAWSRTHDLARCAFRMGYSLRYRNFGVGFRVVCSSP
jgi:formylglycine-generating enzyme required for sulfatase activity